MCDRQHNETILQSSTATQKLPAQETNTNKLRLSLNEHINKQQQVQSHGLKWLELTIKTKYCQVEHQSDLY